MPRGKTVRVLAIALCALAAGACDRPPSESPPPATPAPAPAAANLPDLVARLAAIPGIDDLALTTNGLLLAEHAGAAARPGRPNHPAAWVTAHRPAIPPYPSAPPDDVMSSVLFDDDAVGG